MPSSRSVSEEPELITKTTTTTDNKPLPRFNTDAEKDDKKHRRFSITSFHRSSRSRSRPNSIILPGSTTTSTSLFSNSTPPRGTPPREVSRLLGEDQTRPHSYAAPDSWTQSTPPSLHETLQSRQARLGILPSPAKSAFSAEHEVDRDAPPVPKIPESLLREHGEVSSEVLQSVVRYSTPPGALVAWDGVGNVPGKGPVAEKDGSAMRELEMGEQHEDKKKFGQGESDVGDGAHVLGPGLAVTTASEGSHSGIKALHDTGNDDARGILKGSQPEVSDVDDDERGGLDASLRLPTGGHLAGDVSPLLPPVDFSHGLKEHDSVQVSGMDQIKLHDHSSIPLTLSTGNGTSLENSLHTHSGALGEDEFQRRLLWETEIIGAGDVSPMSSQAGGDDDATPRGAHFSSPKSPKPMWPGNGDLKLPKKRAEAIESSAEECSRGGQDGGHGNARPVTVAQIAGQPAPHRTGGSADGGPHVDQQPRRVSAAPLQVLHAVEEYAASDSSFASWDRDSSAANSVAASISAEDMQDESDLVTPVAQAPGLVQHGQIHKAEPSETNSTTNTNTTAAKSMPPNGYFGAPANTMQQASADLTVPERSKSMLSIISSMVSEGGTPISPSTSNAGRSTPSTIRRMQHEPSIKHGPGPAQILEEPSTKNGDHTTTADDDDDDDFDLYSKPEKPAPAPVPGVQEPEENDGPRYSTDRPMSFISGPPDQDGVKQDQINAQRNVPTTQSDTLQPQEQNRPPNMAPNGVVYSSNPSNHVVRQPGGPELPSTQNYSQPSNGLQSQNMPSGAHGNGIQSPTTSIQPQNPAPGLNMPREHPIIGQQRPFGQIPNVETREPQMHPPNPGQPTRQSFTHQGQTLMPDHDPRFQRQASGPQPGPNPNAQYGVQQQTMHPPGDPRPYDTDNRRFFSGSQHPTQPISRHTDKQSTKPSLSSVFKGLGGKLQGHSQQSAHPNNAVIRPHAQITPIDPDRNGSYQSGVSSLHRDQPVSRQGDQPSLVSASQRPPSNGAESHFSQISQISSTRVQPTDSRLDLRKPASPTPYQGIPPQQILSMASGQNIQPQNYKSNTQGIPESGKKKRFSTLANLFSRTGAKEDKKIPKAQRHSSAPLMQTPGAQWPQQQMYNPQQAGMPHLPGQTHQAHMPGIRPTGPPNFPVQASSNIPPQAAHNFPPQMQQQHREQFQPTQPGQPQFPNMAPENASAYLRTKQLAEEHQARRAFAQQPGQQAPHVPYSRSPPSGMASVQQSSLPHQLTSPNHGAPLGGYYNPDKPTPFPEHTVYQSSQMARQIAEQQRKQSGIGTAGYGPPPGTVQQGLERQQYSQEGNAQRALQAERLRPEQQQQHGLLHGTNLTVQREHLQYPQHSQGPAQLRDPVFVAPNAPPVGPQQPQQPQQPQTVPHAMLQPERQLVSPSQHNSGAQVGAHRENELFQAQYQQQQHEQHMQQNPDRIQQWPIQPSVSGPVAAQPPTAQTVTTQRHVNSHTNEPQYETPQIPAAYSHVSGAFVSPRDRQQPPPFSPPRDPSQGQPVRFDRQYSDPRMPVISPQVSAQSQMPHNERTHSDASTASVVSPISNTSNPSSEMLNSPLPSTQPAQKPRMSSISEIHQGSVERPWHLNFPEGATEQEIVRARQRQYMEEQFTAQQQQQAAKSPSPRISSHSQPATPQVITGPQTPRQDGGFRELLPRNSPQPYPQSPSHPTHQGTENTRAESTGVQQPVQPAPIHPGEAVQPAAYPLPMSPDPAKANSPVNPLAATVAPPPPPQLAQTSTHPNVSKSNTPSSLDRQRMIEERGQYEPSPPQENHYHPPPAQDSQYEQQLPDEPPPSYDGPGVPNDGMDKARPEQSRPPNIATSAEPTNIGYSNEGRQRQSSIGLMQHPQPASMAASPQRSSADMGAESLRKQLLQQEEHKRMERIQRAQMQQAESERERKEREAARARARELERSVSGGTRVGSIRSVAGSRNGGTPGWERRGSTSRPVFELPAVEDDEPAMRATSYPGQEWVPPVWTDD